MIWITIERGLPRVISYLLTLCMAIILCVPNSWAEIPSGSVETEDFEYFSFVALREHHGDSSESSVEDLSLSLEEQDLEILNTAPSIQPNKQRFGQAGISWALGNRSFRKRGLFAGRQRRSNSVNLYGVKRTSLIRTVGIRNTRGIYGFRNTNRTFLGAKRRISGFRRYKF